MIELSFLLLLPQLKVKLNLISVLRRDKEGCDWCERHVFTKEEYFLMETSEVFRLKWRTCVEIDLYFLDYS